MSRSRREELSDHGQSVWIDYLSRDLLRSGALARMVEEDAVVGVTSNPTIFERALADTDAYDGQLAERAPADGGDDKEVFLELAARDGRVRSPPPGVGAERRPRRVGLDRGRPSSRLRLAGDGGRGRRPPRADRPP